MFSSQDHDDDDETVRNLRAYLKAQEESLQKEAAAKANYRTKAPASDYTISDKKVHELADLIGTIEGASVTSEKISSSRTYSSAYSRFPTTSVASQRPEVFCHQQQNPKISVLIMLTFFCRLPLQALIATFASRMTLIIVTSVDRWTWTNLLCNKTDIPNQLIPLPPLLRRHMWKVVMRRSMLATSTRRTSLSCGSTKTTPSEASTGSTSLLFPTSSVVLHRISVASRPPRNSRRMRRLSRWPDRPCHRRGRTCSVLMARALGS